MLISTQNREIRDAVMRFDRRIEEMHLEFQKYRAGDVRKMPEWQAFEREILVFSKRKILDLELSKHLERVMLKFQNRKKIWLRWIEEYHMQPRTEEPPA